jgi:hypothetical protein
VDDLRLRSVLALLAKFGPAGPHPEHVAMLSLALFDALAPEHGIDAGGRELLRYAALLHDVGSAIGYDGHAEHSNYVIQHGNLRGLTEEEVAIIAQVARWHGKARPRKSDEGFARLRKRHRRMVRWLAAILRVAEGLDRSHYQLIRGLRVVRRPGLVTLAARANSDAHLELWAARRRTRELERLLDAVVRVVPAVRAERGVRADSAALRSKLGPPAAREGARARSNADAPPAPRRSSVPPPDPELRPRARARRAPAARREGASDRAPVRAAAAALSERETRH